MNAIQRGFVAVCAMIASAIMVNTALAQRVRFGATADDPVVTSEQVILSDSPATVAPAGSAGAPIYIVSAPVYTVAAAQPSSTGFSLPGLLTSAWDPYQVASRPAAFSGMVTSAPASNAVPQPLPRVPYYTQQPVSATAAPYVVVPDPNCAAPTQVVQPAQTTIVPSVPCGPVAMAPPAVKHFRIYGDYLFLQPGDGATVPFAVPVETVLFPLAAPPAGPVSAVSPGFNTGYRVGFGITCDGISEWGGTYTSFNSTANESAAINPAGTVALQPLVVFPTAPVFFPFFNAAAESRIQMQLADANYRRIYRDPWYEIAYLIGARYAHLEQDFNATFTVPGLTETVDTTIKFDGGGPRLGLEGEFHTPMNGWLVYGNAFASFINGSFRSSYTDADSSVGVIATTSFSDTRIVPILDAELGLGWRSSNECFRISAGYLVSAWFNTVTTSEWIQAVQTVQFNDIHDTLTFNGPVARAEVRF